jgi:hypothetical protein
MKYRSYMEGINKEYSVVRIHNLEKRRLTPEIALHEIGFTKRKL